MLGLRKTKKPDIIEELTVKEQVLSVADRRRGLDFLVAFFSRIRPGSRKGTGNATQNLQRELASLYQDSLLLKNLQHSFLSQLINTNLTSVITESGIPLSRNFWQEFSARLKHKVLPPLLDENDFLYVVHRIFFRKTDYEWVETIPREIWIEFFERIGFSFRVTDPRVQKQLLQSLKVLSFQVAQLGLEKEIVNYLKKEQQNNNPLVLQSYLVRDLEQMLEIGAETHDISSLSAGIKVVVAQCYNCISYIRERHTERGASLNQTYLLILLANRLQRMEILLDLLDYDHHFDTGRFVDFFRLVVRNENRKNSVREFVSQSTGYLAYQIAEHKGQKGGKYITSTRAEYWSMMWSAMSGGAIVCFVAVIKNLLSVFHAPPFWQGFMYSVNYSVGFVAIEETHSTLATKQPAFTASAVAGSLDARKSSAHPNLYNLVVTTAKVSRSQFASFVGNLLIVFPGTFLLAWLYHWLVGSKIAEGEAAVSLLRDQHPWQSLSLLYACNTGVFLFLSSIIAGYVQNKIQYARIADRMMRHPILRASFSGERLQKMAHYIEQHAGSILGNVSLGFFLGMASSIQKIFGIPFDIRHITISAGNVAIGVYGLGIENINPVFLGTVILGVLAIGFMNFLVSFALAFGVAVRSRGVKFKEYREFLTLLWRYFKKYPLDFIRPRKRLITEGEPA
ncbi:MAG: hypothetical protein QM731_04540 [Chitinophagaceae bacterium]